MFLQIGIISLFFMASTSLCICATFFFIHSSVDGHIGCFHLLVIVNSAAMNIGVHVSFQIRLFIFSEYMPMSGITGLLLLLLSHFGHVRLCATP